MHTCVFKEVQEGKIRRDEGQTGERESSKEREKETASPRT